MGRKIQPIYELFEGHTIIEVDNAIKMLSDEEQKLLKIKYGTSFFKPCPERALTQDENYEFTKIRKKINGYLLGKTPRKRNITIYEYYKDFSEEEVDNAIAKLSERDMEILNIKYGDDLHQINPKRKLTKEETNRFNSGIKPLLNRYLTNSNKKIKSIYEYFEGYSSEQIDIAIKMLPKEDLELLNLRFGSDYHNPKSERALTQDENSRFKNIIRYKLKANLKIVAKYAQNVQDKKKEPENNLIEIKEDSINISYLEDNEIEVVAEQQNTTNEINIKESYKKALKLLKASPSFMELFATLTVDEAIIVSLRLGLVNNKCYSSESIASFLKINEERVIEVTRKTLLLYKEKINELLDLVIGVATDNTKKLEM